MCLQYFIRASHQFSFGPSSLLVTLHSHRSNFAVFEMNIAYFRWQEDENVVDITLQFVCEQSVVNKVFNFKRQTAELIESTLNRIRTNVEKEVQKKAKTKKVKKKKEVEEATVIADIKEAPPAADNASVTVAIINANGDALTGITWTEFFIDQPALHKTTVLRVRNVDYSIAFNYPYVARLDLPACILVGYDCYPTKLELQFTSRDECEFVWYKGLPKPNHEGAVKDIKWTPCGEGYIYRVQADDAGHKFKVKMPILIYL